MNGSYCTQTQNTAMASSLKCLLCQGRNAENRKQDGILCDSNVIFEENRDDTVASPTRESRISSKSNRMMNLTVKFQIEFISDRSGIRTYWSRVFKDGLQQITRDTLTYFDIHADKGPECRHFFCVIFFYGIFCEKVQIFHLEFIP